MPRFTIEVLEGRTMEQKRALAKEICDAISECLHVPLDAALLRIIEVPFENFAQGGVLRADASSDEGKPIYGRVLEPRITGQFFAGHPMEEKRALVKRITERIAPILNVAEEDVKIFMIEMRFDQFAHNGMMVCDDPNNIKYTFVDPSEINSR